MPHLWSNMISSFIFILLAYFSTIECQILPTQNLSNDSIFCHCYIWPECLKWNCSHAVFTDIRVKQRLDELYDYFSRLPKPFTLFLSSQNNSANAIMTREMMISLPIADNVRVNLEQSKIYNRHIVNTEKLTAVSFLRDATGRLTIYKSTDYVNYNYIGRANDIVGNRTGFASMEIRCGINGLVTLDQKSYYSIAPLNLQVCSSDDPVIHYAHLNEPLRVKMERSLHRHWKPLEVTQTKNIKHDLIELPVSLIIDHQLFRLLGDQIEDSINYISATFNQAKLLFAETKIQPILVQIEVWNLEERFPIEKSIKTTLNNFAEYQILHRAKHTSSIGKMHIFLTRNRFIEKSDYLSVPNSICTSRSISVISVNEDDTMFHTARTIALSIKDVFGIEYLTNSQSEKCDENVVFNSCDKNLFKIALLLGTGSCLVDNSKPIAETCGNGRIDFGEECDIDRSLGSGAVDNLPCCNPLTCLADVDSVCVSGSCCDKCQFATKTTTCRNATDHCDIPEFCSGLTAECPTNIHLENGHPCQTNLKDLSGARSNDQSQPLMRSHYALCYKGVCPTPISQCITAWGPSSREASPKCYEQFNVKIKSACGVNDQSCLHENVLCGMLHCEGGSSGGGVGGERQKNSHPEMFVTQVTLNNQSVECKYSENLHVLEGSSCGRGKYCFQNQCSYPDILFQSNCRMGSPFTIINNRPLGNEDQVEAIEQMTLAEQITALSMLPIHLLPQKVIDANHLTRSTNLPCSGRGLCTNMGHCFCQPGWFGPQCQSEDPDDIDPYFSQYTLDDITRLWYAYKTPDAGVAVTPNADDDPFGSVNFFFSGLHSLVILVVMIFVLMLFLLLFLFHIFRRKRTKAKNFLGLRSKKNPLTGKVISTADVDLSQYPSGGKSDEKRKREKSRKYHEAVSTSLDDPFKSLTGIVNPGATVNSGQSATDPEASSSIERMIKFGNMPSYKSEKLGLSNSNLPETSHTKPNTSISPLSIELSPNLSSLSNKYYTETPLLLQTSQNQTSLQQRNHVDSYTSNHLITNSNNNNTTETSDHYENHMTLLLGTKDAENPDVKRSTLQGMKGILKNKPLSSRDCQDCPEANKTTNGVIKNKMKKKKVKSKLTTSTTTISSSSDSDDETSTNEGSESSDDSSSSSTNSSSQSNVIDSSNINQNSNQITNQQTNSALTNAHMIANGSLNAVKNSAQIKNSGDEFNQNLRQMPVTQRPLPAQPTQSNLIHHIHPQQQFGFYDFDQATTATATTTAAAPATTNNRNPTSSMMMSGGYKFGPCAGPILLQKNHHAPAVPVVQHSSSASSSSGIQSRENTINHHHHHGTGSNTNAGGGLIMMMPNSGGPFSKTALPPTPMANGQKTKSNNIPVLPNVNNNNTTNGGNLQFYVDNQSLAYSSVDSGTGMNYQYPTQSQLLYSQYQRNQNFPLFEMSDGYETYYQPPCESSSQNIDKPLNSNQSLSSSPHNNNNHGHVTNTSNLSNSSVSQNNFCLNNNSNRQVNAYAVHGSLSTNGSHDEGMLSLDEASNNAGDNNAGQLGRLEVIYQEL